MCQVFFEKQVEQAENRVHSLEINKGAQLFLNASIEV